jgi:DNA-directed RNA polymerase specialized sigma24 family protein
VEPDRHPVVETDLARVVSDREVLAGALDRLPYDQRVVMVLHFHLDLPLTEAATIPGARAACGLSVLTSWLSPTDKRGCLR